MMKFNLLLCADGFLTAVRKRFCPLMNAIVQKTGDYWRIAVKRLKTERAAKISSPKLLNLK
jgi:hypothetical protein